MRPVVDLSLTILIMLVGGAVFTAFLRGRGALVVEGLRRGYRSLMSMWWRVLMGIALAGFVQTLIPKAVIAEWIGPRSGVIGILLGSLAGMVLTGGPFVVIPIIASIYTAGAGAGPIIALLTAANLTRIQSLFVMEMPFFGSRISVSRYMICLFVPPIIGLVGSVLFRLF
jgi:uncharacterized membrane protein YraQ (UPF0718 family)